MQLLFCVDLIISIALIQIFWRVILQEKEELYMNLHERFKDLEFCVKAKALENLGRKYVKEFTHDHAVILQSEYSNWTSYIILYFNSTRN